MAGATPQKPGRGAWAFLGEMGSQGRAQGQGALGVGRISLGHRGHWLEGGGRGLRAALGSAGAWSRAEARAI